VTRYYAVGLPVLCVVRCTLQQSYDLRLHSPLLIAPRSRKVALMLKGTEMRATIGRLSPLLLACGLIYGALQLAASRSESDVPAAGTHSDHPGLLAGLPLDFVENRGQWDAPTRFVARRGAMAASFEHDAIRLQLGAAQPAAISLTFEKWMR
jgi:hypothetical protein